MSHAALVSLVPRPIPRLFVAASDVKAGRDYVQSCEEKPGDKAGNCGIAFYSQFAA